MNTNIKYLTYEKLAKLVADELICYTINGNHNFKDMMDYYGWNWLDVKHEVASLIKDISNEYHILTYMTSDLNYIVLSCDKIHWNQFKNMFLFYFR